MVLIPTGMRYSATVSGGAIKSVHCSFCSSQFVYILRARASGQGRSVMFLDNSGAKGRASERAERALQELLDKGCRPVCCPGCGKYQDNMAKLLRGKKYNWLIAVGTLLALSGGMTWLVYIAQRKPGVGLAAAVGVQLLLAVLCFAYRIYMQFAFDANVGAEERLTSQAYRPQGGMTKSEFEELLRQQQDQPQRQPEQQQHREAKSF